MPKHHERRVVPYRPEQIFDLVADVESYPQFLPWCMGARIRERQADRIVADLIIGFRVYRERFTSDVTLQRPGRIEVTYTDGPFRFLHNRWLLESTPDGGCVVDFDVEFELKSKLLQRMLDIVFGEAIRRMVGAFEARARKLYGPGEAGHEQGRLAHGAG
ncbi:MAG TPA: type II toxin-antitoxin system RatA family toxin [Stellaceae bacterium]|nr:type II toxin-antitoxin system RatA family toxin [Stellaceae bacterium]